MTKHLLSMLATLAAGAALAAPVHYDIDPHHTFPSFEADHLGISVWRGKMNTTTGKVMVDKDAGTGTVDLVIDLASIDFGHDQLNTWARGKSFFEVEKHPSAIYKGKLTGFVGGEPTRVEGTLTMRGVTRPVPITIHSFKCIPHPLNRREMCGADASASFQRDEFGLDAGKAFAFKMNVDLRIQVEAVATE